MEGVIYSEGLIYGGKLAFQNRKKLTFLPCFTLYLSAISEYKPLGGFIYLDGRFNGGFFALRVWGAYTRRGLFSELYGIYTS